RAHRRFGALALDELTDLATDRRERGELLFIAFPSLAAEELDDSQRFGVEEDREDNAAMQPGIRRRRGAQEFGNYRPVGHPYRFCGTPNLTDQRLVGREAPIAADRVEFCGLDVRRVPLAIAAERGSIVTVRPIETPESAPVPL